MRKREEWVAGGILRNLTCEGAANESDELSGRFRKWDPVGHHGDRAGGKRSGIRWVESAFRY